MTYTYQPYVPLDPVHNEEEKWYFYEETWSHRYGPYDTEQTARDELARYCLYLDGKLPGQQTYYHITE